MKRLIVYVHGKGGSAQEAEHYKSLFPKDEVIGFDYRSQTPWQAKKEFFAFFTEQRGRCEHLTLVANSIGAFFLRCPRWMKHWLTGLISSLRFWIWKT
ncbi:MAG: hypothetical protein ACLUS6_14875 [Dysosmobacter sp.]